MNPRTPPWMLRDRRPAARSPAQFSRPCCLVTSMGPQHGPPNRQPWPTARAGPGRRGCNCQPPRNSICSSCSAPDYKGARLVWTRRRCGLRASPTDRRVLRRAAKGKPSTASETPGRSMGLLKRSVANAACIVEIAIPLPTLPRLRGRGREGDGGTGRLTNGCNAGQIRTGSSERTKGPDDAQLHCAPDQEKVFVELVLPESVCTKVCV